MADRLNVYQNIAQVEYDDSPLLKVSQVIVQVEYEPTPEGTWKYTGNVGITATPTSEYSPEWNPSSSIPITVSPASIYINQGPIESVYIGEIPVTVALASSYARSWVYEGSITVTVTPASDYLFPIRYYTGNVGVEVTPASQTKMPIVGWDKYTGYGMLDVSFLTEDPPFWGVDGDISFCLDPTAELIEGIDETHIVASGGMEMGGEGDWTFSTPGATEIVATGGFLFCGQWCSGEPATTYPPSETIEAKSGIKFGGAGVWSQFKPEDLPATVIVSSGGFVMGGAGQLSATTPRTTEIISAGGFKLGGFRPDPVEVTYPGSADKTIDETFAFEMGGEGVWEFRIPTTTVIVSGGAIFQLGGDGIVATKSPPLAVITGDGGFAMGGTGQEAPGFDTWVLTGNGFEPSLYSNFDFNSFAQFRGQFFGAKEDGIYLLSGPDDDGEEIHPGVRIGPTNLGTHNQKRLRTVSIGKQSNGAKVRVQAGDRAGVADVVRGHAFISRNLQAGVMTIDITDFDEVSHVEIIPLVLSW